MEGWMEGWMDGWMDGWLGINISPEDGWMDGWMDGWLVINISPENEHRMYSTTYFSQSMFKTNTCQKRVISVRLKLILWFKTSIVNPCFKNHCPSERSNKRVISVINISQVKNYFITTNMLIAIHFANLLINEYLTVF